MVFSEIFGARLTFVWLVYMAFPPLIIKEIILATSTFKWFFVRHHMHDKIAFNVEWRAAA